MEASNSSVVDIRPLPHGFYELELLKFFSQFGRVEYVRVKRSPKSGRSCGIGYVKFKYPEVAAIAAKTMDRYLMFGQSLRCTVRSLKWEKERPKLFAGRNEAKSIEYRGRSGFIQEKDKRLSIRKQKAEEIRFESEESYLKKCHQMVMNDRKLAEKIKEVGINYTYPPLEMDSEMKAKWEAMQKSDSDIDLNALELKSDTSMDSLESIDD